MKKILTKSETIVTYLKNKKLVTMKELKLRLGTKCRIHIRWVKFDCSGVPIILLKMIKKNNMTRCPIVEIR
ncbi:hypothetical protein MHK_000354, partial [Candidatus Magnetomorum sp. HK-1]